MRKKLFLVISIFLLLVPVYAMAETSDDKKESLKIFPVPEKSGIIGNIKPISLDEATEKAEEVGNNLYKLLQANSVTIFLIGLAIAIFFMILGIFIKTLLRIGFVALCLAFLSFFLINFAPELIGTFISTVQNFFDTFTTSS